MLIIAVFMAFGCAALLFLGVVPARVSRPGRDGRVTSEYVGRSETFAPGAGIGSCTSNGIGYDR